MFHSLSLLASTLIRMENILDAWDLKWVSKNDEDIKSEENDDRDDDDDGENEDDNNEDKDQDDNNEDKDEDDNEEKASTI